jgi:hypothetical protein
MLLAMHVAPTLTKGHPPGDKSESDYQNHRRDHGALPDRAVMLPRVAARELTAEIEPRIRVFRATVA